LLVDSLLLMGTFHLLFCTLLKGVLIVGDVQSLERIGHRILITNNI
jgi:hypothetical protein